MHGSGRTDRDTGSIFALLARRGHGKSFRFPGRHLNPGRMRTEFAVMENGTCQCAIMTTRTAIRINHQHLRHNFLLKIKERLLLIFHLSVIIAKHTPADQEKTIEDRAFETEAEYHLRERDVRMATFQYF
jgi:hypothetical protein